MATLRTATAPSPALVPATVDAAIRLLNDPLIALVNVLVTVPLIALVNVLVNALLDAPASRHAGLLKPQLPSGRSPGSTSVAS